MQNYVGKQIDRYRITERLGMGGMAVVYKAYDTRLERDVAIKLIRVDEIPPSQHERLMKRFEREAKAMAKVSHPNIVPVYDYGEVDGSPYLVMEYIQGGTLKSRIDQPVDYVQALRWLVPITDALRYAHERGVIHRDVKPSNILFDEEDRPVLTDFGIAKILETEEATLTGTGMGVGTPEYMAPEQWQGKASEATDQYALGVVLYELLTGKKPYAADTPAAVAILQATEPLQPPSKLVGDVPDAVEKVLYKAMARNPQDRYQSMAIFHKALVELEQGSVIETGEEYEKSEKEISELRRQEIIPEEYSDNSLSASKFEKIGGSKKQEFALDDELVGEGRTVDEVELGHQIGDRLSKSANKVQAKNQQKGHKKSQSILNKKKVGLGVSSAVIIVFILSLICLAVLVIRIGNDSNKSTSSSSSSNSINRTATMEVQKTGTARSALMVTMKAEKTATAQAKADKTATARAQVTATASSAFAFYENFTIENNLTLEEKEWELMHVDDDYVETYYSDVDLRNFVLEVTFFNPYDTSIGSWDFGILFRENYINNANQELRFIIESDKTWSLYKRIDSTSNIIEQGDVEINLKEGERNSLKFLAINDSAHVFVNGNYLTQLDLSDHNYSGDIKVGIGFFNGDEIEGYFTRIEDLRIYSIEDIVQSTSFPVAEDETKTDSIKINSHAFASFEDYASFDSLEYQVLFENSEGWDDKNYSLMIDTDHTRSTGYYCNFGRGEISSTDCEIRVINEEEYVYCTQEIYLSYYDQSEFYCVYEMRLYADDTLIFNYDYSNTFGGD